MAASVGPFRFGLGPAARLGHSPAEGSREAVLAQLARPVAQPPGDLPSTAEGVRLLVERAAALAAARRTQSQPAPFVTPTQVNDAELAARVEMARTTPAPLHERLALHWANHFTASAQNVAGYLVGAMEREVIRAHMLGRFEALLFASTVHPAMLIYLGNNVSTGPNSPAGQRQRRGLNENLARELLELHSLGVDGGYTQADVIEVAKILTGWTVNLAPDGTPPERRIAFNPDMHEPGARVVLGRRYPEGGEEQLRALIHDLARHPATARHVSRRLVRHFLGETAPPEVAAGLARVFQESEGDLRAVTRALLEHPAAWSLPPRKMRPPIELVLSIARIFDGLPPAPPLRGSLAVMGQPYNRAPSPAGWPEEDDAWATAEAVKTRLDWAIALSARLDPRQDARAVAEAVFGAGLSPETRRTVQRAESGQQAKALLLMSPEFQRR